MNWVTIILNLFHMAGPELKKVLLDALNQWEAKAKETKTPIDDILVGILKILLT